jgi:hypothetical protein
MAVVGSFYPKQTRIEPQARGQSKTHVMYIHAEMKESLFGSFRQVKLLLQIRMILIRYLNRQQAKCTVIQRFTMFRMVFLTCRLKSQKDER